MSSAEEPMSSYDLDELMVQIIADYRTMDDRLSAFLQVFLDEVTLPIEATLLGMPVEVTEFDYFDDGRGLAARCHRPGADQYLTLADLVVRLHTECSDKFVSRGRPIASPRLCASAIIAASRWPPASPGQA